MGRTVQYRKGNSQRIYVSDAFTLTMVWGLPERVWVLGRVGQSGENWDNCNSIINQIKFNKNKNKITANLMKI